MSWTAAFLTLHFSVMHRIPASSAALTCYCVSCTGIQFTRHTRNQARRAGGVRPPSKGHRYPPVSFLDTYCPTKAPAKRGHVVASTLCTTMLPVRTEQNVTLSYAVRTQNCFSETVLCPGRKIWLCPKCCTRLTSNHIWENPITAAMLPPQCVLA